MSEIIKFHANPSSGSRVVTCGRTDMTKLIVALRNFANARLTVTEHKMCVLIFSTTFVRNISYSKKNWGHIHTRTIKNVCWSECKVAVHLARF